MAKGKDNSVRFGRIEQDWLGPDSFLTYFNLTQFSVFTTMLALLDSNKPFWRSISIEEISVLSERCDVFIEYSHMRCVHVWRCMVEIWRIPL